MARVSSEEQARIRVNFDEAVNMTPSELEEWLDTAESRKVGFKASGANESVGHASGRRIVEILRKTRPQLDDMDHAHMRKVVGFIRRHRAQEPGNIVTSRWRYSLMNWGHDPIK